MEQRAARPEPSGPFYRSLLVGTVPPGDLVPNQQLSEDPFSELIRICSDGSNEAAIVVLDTLDLLVGVDDGALASFINRCRAEGHLLATTCRRQEMARLASHVRVNSSFILNRFEETEAQEAIRLYLNLLPDWTGKKKDAQFSKLWGLLDQQRKFHELTFEPLILRMIIEAYHPKDIPGYINTQQVYDKFWKARVEGDRTSRGANSPGVRRKTCLLLAATIVFGEDNHTESASIDSFIEDLTSHGIHTGETAISELVSSGVLRYGKLRHSVGFFHQTFLEYTAVLDLLNLVPRERTARIAMLFVAIRSGQLFLAPVLKTVDLTVFGKRSSSVS